MELHFTRKSPLWNRVRLYPDLRGEDIFVANLCWDVNSNKIKTTENQQKYAKSGIEADMTF